MIPQRNISLISNTLMTAGGRRIPEAVIERDYVLAWFLTGLLFRIALCRGCVVASLAHIKIQTLRQRRWRLGRG